MQLAQNRLALLIRGERNGFGIRNDAQEGGGLFERTDRIHVEGRGGVLFLQALFRFQILTVCRGDADVVGIIAGQRAVADAVNIAFVEVGFGNQVDVTLIEQVELLLHDAVVENGAGAVIAELFVAGHGGDGGGTVAVGDDAVQRVVALHDAEHRQANILGRRDLLALHDRHILAVDPGFILAVAQLAVRAVVEVDQRAATVGDEHIAVVLIPVSRAECRQQVDGNEHVILVVFDLIGQDGGVEFAVLQRVLHRNGDADGTEGVGDLQAVIQLFDLDVFKTLIDTVKLGGAFLGKGLGRHFLAADAFDDDLRANALVRGTDRRVVGIDLLIDGAVPTHSLAVYRFLQEEQTRFEVGIH